MHLALVRCAFRLLPLSYISALEKPDGPDVGVGAGSVTLNRWALPPPSGGANPTIRMDAAITGLDILVREGAANIVRRLISNLEAPDVSSVSARCAQQMVAEDGKLIRVLYASEDGAMATSADAFRKFVGHCRDLIAGHRRQDQSEMGCDFVVGFEGV